MRKTIAKQLRAITHAEDSAINRSFIHHAYAQYYEATMANRRICVNVF